MGDLFPEVVLFLSASAAATRARAAPPPSVLAVFLTIIQLYFDVSCVFLSPLRFFQ